jgi:hypothetical protein
MSLAAINILPQGFAHASLKRILTLQRPPTGICTCIIKTCFDFAETKENEGHRADEQPAVALGGQMVVLTALMGIGALITNLGRSDVQEISFQHFKTLLLASGLVDRVEVTNKSTAKVYVRPSSRCALACPRGVISASFGSALQSECAGCSPAEGLCDVV